MLQEFSANDTPNVGRIKINDNFNFLYGEIQQLSTDILNDIQNSLNAINGQIYGLSVQLNALESRVDGIETRVEVLENKALTRTTITLNVPQVLAGQTLSSSFNIGKAFVLLSGTSSIAARVRLYTRAIYRDQDLNRPIDVSPPEYNSSTTGGEHGVICDLVYTPTNLALDFSPSIYGVNLDAPISSTIYYNITNNTLVNQTITLTFVLLLLEV